MVNGSESRFAMRIETVLDLLDQKQIAGSPQELAVLCTRIGDLVRVNGEAWVVAHRDRLLREWETIVRMKMIR
ncbi:MAG: hypothetical protein JJV98_00815 [Desulfosarcina sp.]|nr:hypothetical protein [Desulfobacterales bacterium]